MSQQLQHDQAVDPGTQLDEQGRRPDRQRMSPVVVAHHPRAAAGSGQCGELAVAAQDRGPQNRERTAERDVVADLLDVAGRSSLVRVLSEQSDHVSADDRSGPIHSWITDRVSHAQTVGEVGEADPATVADLAFALVKASLPHAATRQGARRLQPLLAARLAALLPPPRPTRPA